MKLSELADGIAILRKYFDGGDGYKIGAEHDIIYVYETKRPVDRSDVEKLLSLGWFQPDAGSTGEGEFTADHYDPAESWASYT